MGQDDQDNLCERADEEFGRSYVETVDLTEGMLLVYRVDLAERVIGEPFFPRQGNAGQLFS